MVGRKRLGVPTPLARGRARLEDWRRTRKAGARIPDKLWSLAVKLVDGHGLNRTASVLGLDYYSLKKQVEARHSDSTSVSPAFLELSPLSVAAPRECVIEFEDHSPVELALNVAANRVECGGVIVSGFWSAWVSTGGDDVGKILEAGARREESWTADFGRLAS